MNIKKFLAIILCMAFMISMAAMPAMADDTEFTVEFLGIGSNGIAYDDITLPQTTSAGDAIIWSTNSDVVTVSDDNTTAKIVKYDADKNLDASLNATVDGTPNTIEFKVGYLWAEKAKYTENEEFTVSTASSKVTVRSDSTGTVSVEDGKCVYTNSSTTATADNYYSFEETLNSGIQLIEFDTSIDTSLKDVLIRFVDTTAGVTGKGFIDINVAANGEVDVYNGSNRSDKLYTLQKTQRVSGEKAIDVYEISVKAVVDVTNKTFSLMINDYIIAKDYAFRGGYGKTQRIRIYSTTGKATTGSIYWDNIRLSQLTDAFSGLDKATLNAEATEAGTDTNVVTTGLALPESVTAGSVAWAGSGSLNDSGQAVNQSFFEEKTGTVTATVTGTDSTTYTKSFAFSVAAAEFNEASTAAVTKADDSVTAVISDLTVADGELTVILAAYNTSGTSAKLADVKLTKQEVADDGTLTVTISDLSSDVTDATTYRMFVFDSETSLTPLTIVTVQ